MRRIKRGILLALYLVVAGSAKKFYNDDPLMNEPPPKDASQALSRKLSDYYDLFMHTLSKPGEGVRGFPERRHRQGYRAC